MMRRAVKDEEDEKLACRSLPIEEEMTLSPSPSIQIRRREIALASLTSLASPASLVAAVPFFALVLALIWPAGAAFAQDNAQDNGETDDEKAFYAIGAAISNQFDNLKPISDRELDFVIKGLRDGINGTVVDNDPEANRPRIRKLLQARKEASVKIEKAESEAFLAAEARKPGAVQTKSGLIIMELEPGSGPSPTATNKVKVHYHGTLRDGTVFDSSVDRGQPAEFPLNRVIPCWTEGVAMMKVGGKSRLVCPSEIAYGDQQKGLIPPGAALVFDVELIEIVK
jgi:FKBP-type peptidyl-prolyl cis-trans isomerase